MSVRDWNPIRVSSRITAGLPIARTKVRATL